MNTIAIRTTAYSRAIVTADQSRLRLAVWALAAFIIVLAATYGLLINRTVLNVVSRSQDLKAASVLSAQVNDLQSREVALRNTITPEYAAALGYQPVAEPTFMSLSSSAGASLTYNTVR